MMRSYAIWFLGTLLIIGIVSLPSIASAADNVPTIRNVEPYVAQRVGTDQSSPYPTPYEQSPPPGYRWRTTYVPRRVLETGERDEQVVVRKPVVETTEREDTVTVLRPVTERMEREERVVVRKPVYETSEREETVTVLKPVTEIVERTEQVVVQRPVTTYVWMLTAYGSWIQVPSTQYVSQWETRVTPTQSTRYESQQEVRRIPTQSLRYEEEVRVNKIPVESTRWVEQREVRKTPVTVERMVDQVITQKKPYSEYKTVYEEKRELVKIEDDTPGSTTSERPTGAPRTFREEPTSKPALPNNPQTNLMPTPEIYKPLVTIVSPRQRAVLEVADRARGN